MNTNKTVNIVAAIVDTTRLTIYFEDGTTYQIPQGDVRLNPILDMVIPSLSNNQVATITSDMLYIKDDQQYQNYEKKSTIVRLFRVAKSALANLFSSREAEPQVLGTVPVVKAAEMPDVGAAEAAFQKQQQAIASVMANAVPVQSTEFHEVGLYKQAHVMGNDNERTGKHIPKPAEETMIAVVNGVIIPGIEQIKSQFGNAVKGASTVGMDNFLSRIAAVIDQRRHSVADLFKFLERADLPIADDGTIIIYKVLNRKIVNDEQYYVDVHTGNVIQKVGSKVFMAHALVDHDRRNECSNGLHVARRGYVRNFDGQVCVLAKLAPEDVIAVPEYDADKMRVCAYHIIAELSEEEYACLDRNQPITSLESGKVMLANAIAGNHVGILETVEIGGNKGTNLKISQLETPVEQPKVEVTKTMVDNAVALTNEVPQNSAPVVNPLSIVEKIQETRKFTQAQQICALLPATTPEQAHDVVTLKRSFKKGWAVLGVDEVLGKKLEALAERH